MRNILYKAEKSGYILFSLTLEHNMKTVACALLVIAFLIPLQGSGDVLLCQGTMTSSVHYVKTRELTIPDGTRELIVQLPKASNATLFAYSLKIESASISYSKKPDAVTSTEGRISATWVNPPPKLSFILDSTMTIDVSVNGLNSDSLMPVKPARNDENVSKYLSSSTYVQSQDPEIASVANTIVNNTRYESAAVTSLMLWVNDYLEYDANATRHDASWTFHNKRGTCENYAHLSLALLRSVGIPARYVGGYLVDGDVTVNGVVMSYGYQWSPGPHSWIEVYYPDLGWVPYEPQKTLGFVDDHHVREAAGTDSADVPNKLTYTSATSSSGRILMNDTSDAAVTQEASDLHVVGTSSASSQRVLSQEMAHGGAINDHMNVLDGEGLLVWLAGPIIAFVAIAAGIGLFVARRRRR